MYLAVIVGAYFLPSIVAKSRKKVNTGSIFVLNLFLGWTLLGWVVALVWAVAKDNGPTATAGQSNLPPEKRYDTKKTLLIIGASVVGLIILGFVTMSFSY